MCFGIVAVRDVIYGLYVWTFACFYELFQTFNKPDLQFMLKLKKCFPSRILNVDTTPLLGTIH